MRERLLLLGVALFVFFSRLPFLDAGYGNDPDAWQMANVAQHLAHTGEYAASRLPGYPLPEFVYSLFSLVGLGKPIIFNSATALLSSVGFLLFSLILKICGSKDYVLGGLALAFTPVVFINSTNSMDYIWALTFILASTFFVLIDKTLIGAVFLGLAIGSRVTSGVMLLPLIILIMRQHRKDNLRVLVGFSLVTCTIGALFYAPVFFKYGSGFLTFSGNYPPLLWIVYSASVVVWGTIGVVALALIIVTKLGPLKNNVIRTFRSTGNDEDSREKLLVAAWMLVIVLYLTAFLRLPHDGAYMIPIIPFVILLIHYFFPRGSFILLCSAIILSSFLLTIERNKITLAGPIFNDHQERLEKTDYVERYLSTANSLEHRSLIIAGPWLPQITAMMPADQNQSVKYVWLIGEPLLQSYIEQGYQIYYLSGQRELTIDYYGFDPEEIGARPLIPGDAQGVKW